MQSEQNPISRVKSILREQGIFAKKKWGQHFLVNSTFLPRIIKAAELKPEDSILEVGTGLGVLTLALARQVSRVLTVEKDARLEKWLDRIFQAYPNVKIQSGDILKLPFSHIVQVLGKKYKVVANLPYYLTSHFLKVFLESSLRPTLLVVMVQKEVAERINARPPRMNLLALCCQFYGKPSLVEKVSRRFFWPRPRVDSAIVKIITRQPPLRGKRAENFWRLVRSAFSTRRKQLFNALKNAKLETMQIRKLLLSSKIEGTRRPESLSLEEWLNLYEEYEKII